MWITLIFCFSKYARDYFYTRKWHGETGKMIDCDLENYYLKPTNLRTYASRSPTHFWTHRFKLMPLLPVYCILLVWLCHTPPAALKGTAAFKMGLFHKVTSYIAKFLYIVKMTMVTSWNYYKIIIIEYSVRRDYRSTGIISSFIILKWSFTFYNIKYCDKRVKFNTFLLLL